MTFWKFARLAVAIGAVAYLVSRPRRSPEEIAKIIAYIQSGVEDVVFMQLDFPNKPVDLTVESL